MIGLEYKVNIKWLGTLVFASFCTYFYIRERFQYIIELMVFILLMFVMIPLGYYDSSGDIVITVSYLFIICIGINLVFLKWERWIFTFMVVAIYIFLYLSDYNFMIYDIVWKQQVYDRLINIPLTIFASSIVISLVAKSYRAEHHLLAIKNHELVRVNHRLEEISSTDYLTEIYNRRSIVSKLKAYIDDINIGGAKQLGILLFDIDNFKPVNDTYGHYIGDAVLKTVALELKTLFSNEHIELGRYGGDEFLVVFNNIDDKKTKAYIEELQSKIKDVNLPHHIHIAISGGYIKYRIDRHRTVEKMLIEADKRLYIAKQAGKDRVIAK